MSDVLFHQPKRYECHITIDSLPSKTAERAVRVQAEAHGFHMANMVEVSATECPESNTYLTGHSVSAESYNGLLQRARELARAICYGLHVKVYRIKIEEILFDERYGGVVK